MLVGCQVFVDEVEFPATRCECLAPFEAWKLLRIKLVSSPNTQLLSKACVHIKCEYSKIEFG
jgi:hypothetical protein